MKERSLYVPATRTIVLSPDASLYSKFHELAHKEQHDKMVPAFVAWSIFYRVRVLNYFVTLWVEWDAHRRARRDMEKLGVWSEQAGQEGRNNLMSYAMRKENS